MHQHVPGRARIDLIGYCRQGTDMKKHPAFETIGVPETLIAVQYRYGGFTGSIILVVVSVGYPDPVLGVRVRPWPHAHGDALSYN